jgi:hypothetical protein
MGAKLRQVTVTNGVIAWGMSCRKYIKVSVENVQEHMDTRFAVNKLWKKETAPCRMGYNADINEMPVLDA